MKFECEHRVSQSVDNGLIVTPRDMALVIHGAAMMQTVLRTTPSLIEDRYLAMALQDPVPLCERLCDEETPHATT